MGLDGRAVSPELVREIVLLAPEVRSFARATKAIRRIFRTSLSVSTIRRLAKEVGLELLDADDTLDQQESAVPQVAVVSCDGGRIRTREPGVGRGVRPSGENGWRETKNASLERMTTPNSASGVDPCPDLPTTFRTRSRVAQIVGKPALNVDEPPNSQTKRIAYHGPERVLRTVLSSMACSDDFGTAMQREADRRRFFESPRRAFLGDGLGWNWSIQKTHFPTFVPILDFIHAIEYVYAVAMCVADDETARWGVYVHYVTLCWQGRVDDVIALLADACENRGVDRSAKIEEDDPNRPLVDAVRYLSNHRARMDYPRYRRLGLPVTSSPMESLVRQINLRVKGTEMFWDDPNGAEAILQLRAAILSDDGRLERYLDARPGCPFVRRSTFKTAT